MQSTLATFIAQRLSESRPPRQTFLNAAGRIVDHNRAARIQWNADVQAVADVLAARFKDEFSRDTFLKQVGYSLDG